VLAFGLLGAGAMFIGLAFLRELDEPTWLSLWGLATGLLGLLASLSLLYPALSFLPGPMNISLLAWSITPWYPGRADGLAERRRSSTQVIRSSHRLESLRRLCM
jgi:hypothetical protein